MGEVNCFRTNKIESYKVGTKTTTTKHQNKIFLDGTFEVHPQILEVRGLGMHGGDKKFRCMKHRYKNEWYLVKNFEIPVKNERKSRASQSPVRARTVSPEAATRVTGRSMSP